MCFSAIRLYCFLNCSGSSVVAVKTELKDRTLVWSCPHWHLAICVGSLVREESERRDRD